MKKQIKAIGSYLLGIVKSALKFFGVSWCFFVALNVFTVTAWGLGWLGEDCRYYGSIVERCFLFGKSVDALLMTELILTPFVLPVIGLIAGPAMVVMGAIAQAILATMFAWPVFLVLRKLTLFVIGKFKKSSTK